MNSSKLFSSKVKKLTYTALITAIVVCVQLLSSVIKFGPFSITLAHIPIIVGGALLGPIAGAWFGLVFGITVLLSGDAAFFLGFSVPGTIATVLIKGLLAGLLSALVYKLFEKKNRYAASFIAAVVCPIVNTGTFLLLSRVFLYDAVTQLATDSAWGGSIALYMIVGLVGVNFIVEFIVNVVLAPVVFRIVGAMGSKHEHYV